MPDSDNNQTHLPTADQLWQFSLTFYPSVKAQCLKLQDTLGANVNMLMLLCLLEQRQLAITAAQLQQLHLQLTPFSERFTQPLRELRKQTVQANLPPEQQLQLKQALLDAELQLEQLEQHLILQYCPAPFATNTGLLEHYLALLGNSCGEPSVIVDLRQALAACPPSSV